MVNVAKKPFYGLTAFVSSIIISVIPLLFGILIFLLFSSLIGIIIFCVGLYLLFSYIISIYLINPTKSLDLSSMLILKGDELVLDVGCGLGRATVGVAKYLKTGKIIGVDIWDKLEIPGNSPEKAYKNAEIEDVINKVEFRFGDVFDLPFDEEYFDIVICSGLITSFHNDEQKIKAMREIRRVLKTNGTFYMREPVMHLITFIILNLSSLLIKLPSKNHWIELLEKSGFKVIKYFPHRMASSFKMIKPKINNNK